MKCTKNAQETKKKYDDKIKKDVKRKVREGYNSFRGKNNSVEEFSKARLDLRVNRDARFANFVNEFTNYVDPFRTKELYDTLKSVDPKHRSRKKLQIGVITRLEERLSEVEALERWNKIKVRNGVVEDKEFEPKVKNKLSIKYAKEKTSSILNKYVPDVVAEAVETVRKASSTVWPKLHKDHAMRREYSERLSDQEVVRECIRDVTALSLKALARLEYFVAGIESVADTLERRSASESQK